jgi:hypothetical protein
MLGWGIARRQKLALMWVTASWLIFAQVAGGTCNLMDGAGCRLQTAVAEG